MKHCKRRYFSFLTALWLLVACGEDNSNLLEIDVSDIKVDMKVQRWDQLLAETNNYDSLARACSRTDKRQWRYYTKGVLNLGDPSDPMFPDNFEDYVSQPHIQDLILQVDSAYSDVSNINGKLEDAFKHLKYYYPEAYIPELIYVISFFNRSIWSSDSALFISLDYYLGRDNKIVRTLPPHIFYDYIKDRMDKHFLIPDIIHSWMQAHYLDDVTYDRGGYPEFDSFLDGMIYYGKLMYAIDALLPSFPPHLKMRYTEEEITFAVSNEQRIWVTMVDRRMIHSKDAKLMTDFFRAGPFTPGLKDNSVPDRIGVFMGWQIVKDYMNNNPSKKLPDLLQIKDNQKILNSYKPGGEE